MLSELHRPDTSSNKKNALADILNENAGDGEKRSLEKVKEKET